MKDKTVVVTGGTSGIGEVAALRLAEQGARIALVARDTKRAEATLAKLKRANPSGDHCVYLADLGKLSDAKRIGAEIAAHEPKIDVLINNAGALFAERQEVEGLERTFALNHMSYVVLTHLLLDRLKAAGAARIVSTASAAHLGATLDFDDLQSAKSFQSFSVYGRSKLCNILFTRALAKRLQGGAVTANCLHPGFVATRFGGAQGFMSAVIDVAKFAAISPEKGADTIIWLASSPEAEGKSGGYYVRRKLTTPSGGARDDAAAERLWDVSMRIAGFA